MAAPFDPVRLEVAGPSVLVLEGVSSSGESGSSDFGVSRDGSLVYVPGKLRGTDRRLVRVNRAGKSRPLVDSRREFSSLSLSPDGRRLALTIEAANDQIWVYDLERSTLSPQTLRGNNNEVIWTPDGRRLTFSSTQGGASMKRMAAGRREWPRGEADHERQLAEPPGVVAGPERPSFFWTMASPPNSGSCNSRATASPDHF